MFSKSFSYRIGIFLYRLLYFVKTTFFNTLVLQRCSGCCGTIRDDNLTLSAFEFWPTLFTCPRVVRTVVSGGKSRHYRGVRVRPVGSWGGFWISVISLCQLSSTVLLSLVNTSVSCRGDGTTRTSTFPDIIKKKKKTNKKIKYL